MPRCHDNRRKKKVRKRRKRTREFLECHMYISLVSPYTDLEIGPLAIPKDVRMHFLTQSKIGNYKHLTNIF